ncbi:organic cation transporter protein [Biomphalaria glabrata]
MGIKVKGVWSLVYQTKTILGITPSLSSLLHLDGMDRDHSGYHSFTFVFTTFGWDGPRPFWVSLLHFRLYYIWMGWTETILGITPSLSSLLHLDGMDRDHSGYHSFTFIFTTFGWDGPRPFWVSLLHFRLYYIWMGWTETILGITPSLSSLLHLDGMDRDHSGYHSFTFIFTTFGWDGPRPFWVSLLHFRLYYIWMGWTETILGITPSLSSLLHLDGMDRDHSGYHSFTFVFTTFGWDGPRPFWVSLLHFRLYIWMGWTETILGITPSLSSLLHLDGMDRDHSGYHSFTFIFTTFGWDGPRPFWVSLLHFRLYYIWMGWTETILGITPSLSSLLHLDGMDRDHSGYHSFTFVFTTFGWDGPRPFWVSLLHFHLYYIWMGWTETILGITPSLSSLLHLEGMDRDQGITPSLSSLLHLDGMDQNHSGYHSFTFVFTTFGWDGPRPFWVSLLHFRLYYIWMGWTETILGITPSLSSLLHLDGMDRDHSGYHSFTFIFTTFGWDGPRPFWVSLLHFRLYYIWMGWTETILGITPSLSSLLHLDGMDRDHSGYHSFTFVFTTFGWDGPRPFWVSLLHFRLYYIWMGWTETILGITPSLSSLLHLDGMDRDHSGYHSFTFVFTTFGWDGPRPFWVSLLHFRLYYIWMGWTETILGITPSLSSLLHLGGMDRDHSGYHSFTFVFTTFRRDGPRPFWVSLLHFRLYYIWMGWTKTILGITPSLSSLLHLDGMDRDHSGYHSFTFVFTTFGWDGPRPFWVSLLHFRLYYIWMGWTETILGITPSLSSLLHLDGMDRDHSGYHSFTFVFTTFGWDGPRPFWVSLLHFRLYYIWMGWTETILGITPSLSSLLHLDGMDRDHSGYHSFTFVFTTFGRDGPRPFWVSLLHFRLYYIWMGWTKTILGITPSLSSLLHLDGMDRDHSGYHSFTFVFTTFGWDGPRPFWVSLLHFRLYYIWMGWTETIPLEWINIVLALVGKCGAAAAFAIIYIYSAELFPTVLRNSLMGVTCLFARAGGMISPYIADLDKLLTGQLGKALPLIVFGATAVAGGIMCFILPETLNKPLPETLENAVDFGRASKRHRRHAQDVNDCEHNEDKPLQHLTEVNGDFKSLLSNDQSVAKTIV